MGYTKPLSFFIPHWREVAMLQGGEKRGCCRMDVACCLSYRLASEQTVHEGCCRNLSDSGISFHGPVPVEAGQALEVSLLPSRPSIRALDAYVEVIRCEREGSGYAIAASIQAIKGL